ncbi:hypothetical protein F5883DRAFT_45246 [Diaporthe sp. PMI_573]|nr:hypothetical protein F5883DRAFT_45246 [Diaporthaceae sp. PMI_573]
MCLVFLLSWVVGRHHVTRVSTPDPRAWTGGGMRLGRGTYDMNGLYWWSSLLAVCFDDAQRHARLCGTETGAEVER